MADSVYDQLRKSIVTFVLRPGERISPEEIARSLNVSATPVREALHRLVKEGLVEQRPYVGFFVTSLTIEDIEELFEIRKTLENLALQRLILNSRAQLQIQYLLQKLEDIKAANFPASETQLFDEEFHINFLLCHSNGRWLTKIARNVIDLILMSTRMSHNPQAAYEEHYAILRALGENNKAEAARILLFHLDRAKNETIHYYAKEVVRGV